MTVISPATETHGVELLTGSNPGVDIQLSLGTLQQTVSVGAQAAVVESSQSTQGGSICPTEVAEPPILNRTIVVMIDLIPGPEKSPQQFRPMVHCRTGSRGRSVRRCHDQL